MREIAANKSHMNANSASAGNKNAVLVLGWFAAIAIVGLGVLNAYRQESLGTDTAGYIVYFNNILFFHERKQFEPLFHFLAFGLNKLGLNHHWFLGAIYGLVSLFYAFFCVQLVRGVRKPDAALYLFLIPGFVLASSWFLVATTNGLRQGLAVPLAWISVLSLIRGRYGMSVFAFVAAVGFHLSALVLVPGLILWRVKGLWLFFITISLGFGYCLGVNEAIVATMSQWMGTFISYDVYSSLKSFGADSGNWVGFQWDLFLYSMFWVVFYFGINGLVIRSGHLWVAWRIYCICLMPFLLFGFGGYSNRFAFYAWMLVPVLHSLLVVNAKIDRFSKYAAAIFVFGMGFVQYGGRMVGLP